MADTFDSRLKLRLQESGANSGQWGTLLNQTITNIASVFGFGTHQLTSDADATLTLSDDGASVDALKSSYLKITSSVSLTATRTLTFAPNTLNQVKYIENATTGSQSLVIKQGSGATVSVASGKTAVVYFTGSGSGAAVVDALAGVDPGVTDTLAEVLSAGNATGGTDIAVGTGDDITFADNAKAIFGASSDLRIYHDGSNSYIEDAGTGNLRIMAQDFRVVNSANSESMIQADNDGAVRLYHNNSAKLATTSTGIDVTDNVSLPDDGVLSLGSSDEFTLRHHNSGYSHLINTTGTLFIDSDSVTFRDDDGSPTNVLINQSGINVTGSVTADGVTVGNSNLGSNSSHLANITLNNNGYIGSASATTALQIQTSGNAIFSGNVGIGTSSITSGKLQVIGGTSGLDQISLSSNVTNNTTKFAGIVMTNYGNTTTALLGGKAENGTTSVFYGSSGSDHRGPQNHIFYTNASATATSGNTEVMRISGDKVGIGTDNPQRLLTVSTSGAALFSLVSTNDDNCQLLFGDSASDTIGKVVYDHGTNHMRFETNGSEAMRITSDNYLGIVQSSSSSISNPLHITKEIAGYQAVFDNDNGSAQGLKVRVKANDSGNFNILELVSASTGTNLTAMNVRDDGKVGIGQSVPLAHVHIKTGTNTPLLLESTSGGGGYVEYRLGASGAVLGYLGSANELITGGSSSDLGIRAQNELVFATNTHVERARIHTDGKFEMTGTSSFIHQLTGSSFSWLAGTDNNRYNFYTADGNLRGYLTASGVFTDTSDLAYKKEIQDLSYGLAEVKQMQPRAYKMKINDEDQLGFIAQEMEQIIPEVVSGEDGSKGLAYGHLVPVLVKAIQEQQTLIESLTDRIAALEQ